MRRIIPESFEAGLTTILEIPEGGGVVDETQFLPASVDTNREPTMPAIRTVSLAVSI